MEINDSVIETALIHIDNRDWASLHDLILKASDDEKKIIEKEMDGRIEDALSYGSYVGSLEHIEMTADVDDEIPTYEGTSDK